MCTDPCVSHFRLVYYTRTVHTISVHIHTHVRIQKIFNSDTERKPTYTISYSVMFKPNDDNVLIIRTQGQSESGAKAHRPNEAE